VSVAKSVEDSTPGLFAAAPADSPRLVYSQLKIGTPAPNFKTLQAGVFLIPNPAELTTEDTESTEAEWFEIL
jgi:hypothetical protein